MKSLLQKYFANKTKIRKDSEIVEILEQTTNPIEDSVESKLQQIQGDIGKPVKDIREFSEKLLSSFARILGISQGAFFIAEKTKTKKVIKFMAGYAYPLSDTENIEFEFGQGLSGQVALDGKMIIVDSIPEGYITIVSGLGQSSPDSMIIFPVKKKDEVIAVVELASFKKFTNEDKELISMISPSIEESLIKLSKQKK